MRTLHLLATAILIGGMTSSLGFAAEISPETIEVLHKIHYIFSNFTRSSDWSVDQNRYIRMFKMNNFNKEISQTGVMIPVNGSNISRVESQGGVYFLSIAYRLDGKITLTTWPYEFQETGPFNAAPFKSSEQNVAVGPGGFIAEISGAPGIGPNQNQDIDRWRAYLNKTLSSLFSKVEPSELMLSDDALQAVNRDREFFAQKTAKDCLEALSAGLKTRGRPPNR